MNYEQDSPFEPGNAEAEMTGLKIATDRCKNFLIQKTPLSEEGLKIKPVVEAALEGVANEKIFNVAEDLPTIEDPKLKLFEPFRLAEAERKVVFGHSSLSAVQLTTGCTHQCDMCDNPEQKLSLMPEITVAQIGQEIKKAEAPVYECWEDWTSQIKKITGFDLNEINTRLILELEKNGLTPDLQKLIETIQKEFYHHPISEFFEQPQPVPKQLNFDPKEPRKVFQLLTRYYPFAFQHFRRDLNMFYQGDCFDWRGKTLRHKDGKPADFGDAFKFLTDPLRPGFISTAGYPENDPLGPVAIQKIIEATEESPYLLRDVRISVSPTDRLAKKDLSAYKNHMQKIIDEFHRIPIRVTFRYDQDGSELQKNFENEVRTPLIQHVEKLRENVPKQYQDYFIRVQTGGISHWYQRAENPAFEDDEDPGACMGGIHILPNWQIARQAGSEKTRPEKGSRPELTGLSLY